MTDPFHPSSYARDEQYSVMDFCAQLWRKRVPIAMWGALFALVTAAYLFSFTKPYTAEALLRIDADVGSAPGLFARGPDINLDAEIDFIRSRSMFTLALAELGPSVDVIGADAKLTSTMQGMLGMTGENTFASALPELHIDRLQVPDRLLNQRLTLRIEKEGHYSLYDSDNKLLVSDVPAEKPEAGEATGANPVQLTISHLTAEAGRSYTIIPRSPKNFLAELQKQLKIETIGRRERSGFIRLSFSSDHSEFSKRFLAALVDTYVHRAYDVSSMGKFQAITRLDDQLKATRSALEIAETKLKDFQESAGTVDMTAEMQLALEQLMAVENQIRTVHAKQKELGAFYTAEHPTFRSVTDQLHFLETEQLRKQEVIDRFPETQRQLLQYKRDVEMNRKMFEVTSEKLAQLRNEAASITGYAKVVDDTELVPGSGMLNVLRTVFLAFVAGCFVGAITIYSTYFSPLASVISSYQLSTLSDLPVLGMLSRMSVASSFLGRRREKHHMPLLGQGQVDLARFPDMVGLMRNLGFASFGSANSVLMVASQHTHYQSGIIAANIATMYAKTSRTLLIDCSMRAQGIHTYFNLHNEPGLSDMLIGKAPVDQAIHSLSENLSFLPGGTPTSYGNHLLHQPYFIEILKEFSKSFRYIVLYYPAVREEQAASALMEYVGSIAFVIGAGEKLERIRRFLDRFRNHANVKGLILDDIR